MNSINMTNFNYLFKYIIVGDSCKNDLINNQLSESQTSCFSFRKKSSRQTTKSQSESNLVLRIFQSVMIKYIEYKYGIR
jgi:hypothetical protein